LSLPTANPDRAAEVARLADVLRAVPRIMAAVVGWEWDPSMSPDVNGFTFQGGIFAWRWTGDAPIYPFGGAQGSEEIVVSGEAVYALFPIGEGDDLDLRHADLLIGLAELRAVGSQVAGLDALIDTRPPRYIAPDQSTAGITIIAPVTFRIHIQVLEPYADVG